MRKTRCGVVLLPMSDQAHGFGQPRAVSTNLSSCVRRAGGSSPSQTEVGATATPHANGNANNPFFPRSDPP